MGGRRHPSPSVQRSTSSSKRSPQGLTSTLCPLADAQPGAGRCTPRTQLRVRVRARRLQDEGRSRESGMRSRESGVERDALRLADVRPSGQDGAYSPHHIIQYRRDTIRTSAPRRTTGSVQGRTDGGAEPDAARAYALCTTPPAAVACWVPCLRRVPTPVARRASRLAYAVTLDQSGVGSRARAIGRRAHCPTGSLAPHHC